MTRPTFPIFAWNVPVKHFDRWIARGINVLMGAGLEVADTPAARLDWAKAAAAKGLWVIGDFRPNRPDNLYQALFPVDEADRLQADKNQPVWNGLTPAQLKPYYDAMRAAYPNDTIHMTLTGDHLNPGRIPYYQSIAGFADTFSEDWYPFSKNAQRYSNLNKVVALDTIKQATGKPAYSIIETVLQNLKDSPFGRQTTPAEVVDAMNIAISKGAKGIGFFSHVFNGNGGWVDFDRTPQDVSDAITGWIKTANLNPAPTPTPPVPDPIAAMQAKIDALTTDLKAVAAKAQGAQDTLDKIGAIFASKQP